VVAKKVVLDRAPLGQSCKGSQPSLSIALGTL